MCNPTWPRSIGKQAFTDYATERGWSAEQIEKAWLWCTTRQNKINSELLAESERKRKEAEAAKLPAPCVCTCPSCTEAVRKAGVK